MDCELCGDTEANQSKETEYGFRHVCDDCQEHYDSVRNSILSRANPSTIFYKNYVENTVKSS